MRNVAIGLITLVLVVSCSADVSTETVVFEPEDPTLEATDDLGASDSQPPTAVPSAVPTADPTTSEEPSADEPANDGLFPTVVGAAASTNDGETWKVDVTLSSEYDSAERYADAWRVLDADDNELGIRVLAHDHATEQPFTRSTSVAIPAELETVFVEGRDQLNGWSGERFELTLER